MDAITTLRQQALAKRNARILAAKREYHAALMAIKDLARKLDVNQRGRPSKSADYSGRRFTRLTNGHSKSLRHHKAMQSLFVAWYNFGRKHEALKGKTPAMASALSDHVWSVKELVERAAEC